MVDKFNEWPTVRRGGNGTATSYHGIAAMAGWFGDQDEDDAGSDDDIPENLRDIAGRAWFGSNYQLGCG
jgi:hypothetical protein